MDRNGSCGPEPAARLRAGRDRRILEAVESVMAGRKRKSAPSREFVDGTPADDIRKVLKAGQKGGGHSKAAPMPLACPWRREGEAGGTTAQRIDGSASAVCGWLSRMHRGGLGAGYDRAKPGRPRRIDPKLRGRAPDAVDWQPEGCGTKPNVRTGRLILIMLSWAFGVNGIPPGTACRTAHGMGRSYKKPGRPLGRRAPSG